MSDSASSEVMEVEPLRTTGAPRATGRDRPSESRQLQPTPRRSVGLDLDRLLLGGAVGVVVLGVALRFWTTSQLWLDEALTVNIASQPLSHLHFLLQRDGAPPLYYAMLHVWMGLFGSSNLAVRSLSGVLSCATVPFVWLATKRIAGRTAASAAALLLASSPFAVRYATETRMYSLVAFLVAAGAVALQKTLARPRLGNCVGLAICCCALLYTHYWALYLLSVTGAWLVWVVWRGPLPWRRGARWALVAMAVGCLGFLPWLPTFVYQSQHTGTPWAAPASFAAMVNAVSDFAGGGSSQGRALGLLFFALAGVGLFGVGTGRYQVELDLRTRPKGRPLALITVGTLALAIVGGHLSASTFSARYAMVVLVPLVMLVAIGLAVFTDRRVRLALLAAAVVFGLAGTPSDVTGQRTEAPRVAAALASMGKPGDVVAYCPDQLGPDVYRLLPKARYEQITFPRGTSPEFVNWVDYAKATAAANPIAFAQHLIEMAGNDHQIWFVWNGGYETYKLKCETILVALTNSPGVSAEQLVAPSPSYYEPMHLERVRPPGMGP